MVILVDEQDKAIGEMEKMQAHRLGLLHRAFSVFILNSKGEILLQQRALSKYHSGGLWTNTCCSHPFPGEEVKDAAIRRLKEEMGLDHMSLTHSGSFIYKAELDQGLTEHEFDHVFYGYCDTDPVLNRDEVEAFRWISPDELRKELKENPEQFTVWFRIIAEKAMLPF
jgi:isopentenyl-diphosphate delta-isomerase